MIKKSVVVVLSFVFLTLFAPQRSASEKQKNTAALLAAYTAQQQSQPTSFLEHLLTYGTTKNLRISALTQLHQLLLHHDEIDLQLATNAFAELDTIAQTLNPTNPIHAQELFEKKIAEYQQQLNITRAPREPDTTNTTGATTNSPSLSQMIVSAVRTILMNLQTAGTFGTLTISGQLTVDKSLTGVLKATAGVVSAGLVQTNNIEDLAVTYPKLAGSIPDAKLNTISTAGKVSNSATTATATNEANTIVARDSDKAFTAQKVVLGADPAEGDLTSAATVKFVLDRVQGLVPHTACLAYGATAITSPPSGAQTIDDVALVAGNRVLLNAQASAIENGIWVVAAGLWTRPTDFDTGDAAGQAYVTVTDGQTYWNTSWVCATPTAVIGTGGISFIQFSGLAKENIVYLPGATGTGEIYSYKDSSNFMFRKILAGANISVTNPTNDVVIATSDTISIPGALTVTTNGASITGTTNINTGSGTAATNIGTGTTAGNITIGRSGNFVGIGGAPDSVHTLAVSGSSNVSGNLTVDGSVTSNGIVTLTNGAQINGATSIIGNTRITGDATVRGGNDFVVLDVINTGTQFIVHGDTGAATVANGLTISAGGAAITGTSSITGATTITGATIVKSDTGFTVQNSAGTPKFSVNGTTGLTTAVNGLTVSASGANITGGLIADGATINGTTLINTTAPAANTTIGTNGGNVIVGTASSGGDVTITANNNDLNAVNINNGTKATTNINTGSASDGPVYIGHADGTVPTINIMGITNINTGSSAQTTNIGNGTATGNVSIGNSTGTTSITGNGTTITATVALPLNLNASTGLATQTNVGTGTTSGATSVGNTSATTTLIGNITNINSTGTNAVNVNAGTGTATPTNIGTGNTTGLVKIGDVTNAANAGVSIQSGYTSGAITIGSIGGAAVGSSGVTITAGDSKSVAVAGSSTGGIVNINDAAGAATTNIGTTSTTGKVTIGNTGLTGNVQVLGSTVYLNDTGTGATKIGTSISNASTGDVLIGSLGNNKVGIGGTACSDDGMLKVTGKTRMTANLQVSHNGLDITNWGGARIAGTTVVVGETDINITGTSVTNIGTGTDASAGNVTIGNNGYNHVGVGGAASATTMLKVTGTTELTDNVTIDTNGLTITAGGASITGNTDINAGAGAGTTNIGTHSSAGLVTIGGGNNVVITPASGGTVSISTSGDRGTNIDTDSTGTVTIGNINTPLSAAVTILGVTNINNSGIRPTSIGRGTSTGQILIGTGGQNQIGIGGSVCAQGSMLKITGATRMTDNLQISHNGLDITNLGGARIAGTFRGTGNAIIVGTVDINSTGTSATNIGTGSSENVTIGGNGTNKVGIGGAASATKMLKVTGTTELTDNLTINTNGLTVTAGGVTADAATINGTTGLTGTTNINVTGGNNTQIGTAGNFVGIGGAPATQWYALKVTGTQQITQDLLVGGNTRLNTGLTGFLKASTGTISAPSTTISHADLATDAVEADNIKDGAVTNIKTTAASTDTPSAIVARDGSGNFITNMITIDGSPSADKDVATVKWVQDNVQGLNIKGACNLVSSASNTDIDLNATSGQSIDGVAVAVGNRILLIYQNSRPANNGIWEINDLDPGLTYTWVRPSDFDTGSQANGAYTFISAGSTLSGTAWVCNSPAAQDTVGTDALTFVQFSGANSQTMENVGSGSGDVFKEKDGNTFKLRRLLQGSSNLAISTGTNDVTVDTGSAISIAGPFTATSGGASITGATTINTSGSSTTSINSGTSTGTVLIGSGSNRIGIGGAPDSLYTTAFTGNTKIIGDLYVTSTITASKLLVLEQGADMIGSTTITGSAYINVTGVKDTQIGLTGSNHVGIGGAADAINMLKVYGTTENTGQLTIDAGGLTVTADGVTVTAGGANITGTTNITGATTVKSNTGFTVQNTAGDTNRFTVDGSTGAATVANGLTVSAGGATVTGTSSITGATTITGVTTVKSNSNPAFTIQNAAGTTDQFMVNGSTGTATLANKLTIPAGGLDVIGTTSINKSGSAYTCINYGSSGTVLIGNSTGKVGIGGLPSDGASILKVWGTTRHTDLITIEDGGLTVTAGGEDVTGTTNINAGTGTAATNIGTGASAGTVTIGNNANVILDSALTGTVFINDSRASTTEINTTSGTGWVNIGNPATTVTMLGNTTVNNTGAGTTTIAHDGGGNILIGKLGSNQVGIGGPVDGDGHFLKITGDTHVTGGIVIDTVGLTVEEGGARITGDTTINTATGAGTTSIGTHSSAGKVTIGGGNDLELDSKLTGTVFINNSGAGSVDINALSGAGFVYIGNPATTVTMLGNTTVNNTGTGTTSIGTGSNTGNILIGVNGNNHIGIGGSVPTDGALLKVSGAAHFMNNVDIHAGGLTVDVGGANITGNTVINTAAGAGTTSIGTYASAGLVTIGGGNNVVLDSASTGTVYINNNGTGTTDINTSAGKNFVNIGNLLGPSTVNVLGAVNINTAGSGDTHIGNGTNTGDITIGSLSGGDVILIANNDTGNHVYINDSSSAETKINTTSGTGTVTIGNIVGPSTTAIIGTTNINTASGQTTAIGTGGTGAVTIGNSTGKVGIGAGALGTNMLGVTGTTEMTDKLTIDNGGLTVTAGGASITGTTAIAAGAGTVTITGNTNINTTTANNTQIGTTGNYVGVGGAAATGYAFQVTGTIHATQNLVVDNTTRLNRNLTGFLKATNGTVSSQLQINNGDLATDSVITANLVDQAVTSTKTDATSANIPSRLVVRDASGNFSAHMISILNSPSNSTDGTNKAYVDSVSQGFVIKTACNALDATVGKVYPFSGTGPIDTTVTLVAGSRVLVINAADGIYNGIWEVGAGPGYVWDRPADFANATSARGAYTAILAGTVYQGTTWVCTNPIGSSTIGTNALTWSQFGGFEQQETIENIGTGSGEIYKDKIGNTFNLRTLLNGSNINITTNTTGPNIDTVSIASTDAISIPGALTVTTNGAAITGATTINTSGAATTTIGVGGTGAVTLGNGTGKVGIGGSVGSNMLNISGKTDMSDKLTIATGGLSVNGATDILGTTTVRGGKNFVVLDAGGSTNQFLVDGSTGAATVAHGLTVTAGGLQVNVLGDTTSSNILGPTYINSTFNSTSTTCVGSDTSGGSGKGHVTIGNTTGLVSIGGKDALATELLDVFGNTKVRGTLVATGSATAAGATINGTTTINNTGSASTNIGTDTNTGNVTIGNSAGGNVTIVAKNLDTNFVNINVDTKATTNINTGGSDGPVYIGNDATPTVVTILGTTSINAGSSTKATNIGTGAGTVSVGNATNTTGITGSVTTISSTGTEILGLNASTGSGTITNVGTGTTSGTTSVGNTSATTTLTGNITNINSTGTNAINLNAGTGTATPTNINTGSTTGLITLGNVTTAASQGVSIQSGYTSGTIAIGSVGAAGSGSSGVTITAGDSKTVAIHGSSTAGAVDINASALVATTNIGTGTTTGKVTIGSTGLTGGIQVLGSSVALNDSGAGSTSVGTGTGTVSIGNTSNTTNITGTTSSLSGTTLNINKDNSTATTNVGTGTTTGKVTVGSTGLTGGVQVLGSSVALNDSGSGATSVGTGTGTVSVGNTSDTTSITGSATNINTGAATGLVTIGNITAANTGVSIQSGFTSGAITIGTAGAVDVGSSGVTITAGNTKTIAIKGATTGSVDINTGTGAATTTNIGTGSTTGKVTIGNTGSGFLGVELLSGTGGTVALNDTGAGAVTVGSTAAGNITILTNPTTGIVAINDTAGAATTNIGTGTSTGTVGIGNTLAGNITIQTKATGTVNINTGAVAAVTNIGTGSNTGAINIGNATSGGAVTITAANAGNVNITTGTTTATTTIGNANSTFTLGTNHSNVPRIAESTNGLRIIRGYATQSGTSAPVLAKGSGFSFGYTSTGTYTFTYTSAFPVDDVPAVSVIPAPTALGNNLFAMTYTLSNTGGNIRISRDNGTATNCGFAIIAVGTDA